MTAFWIILAIYVVSIPISVLCVFFPMKEKTIRKDKNDILVFVIVFLLVCIFSPVLVLLSPILFFKKIIRNKQEQKEKQEKESTRLKLEQEKTRLMQDTKATLKSMSSYLIEENNPLLCSVTYKILDAINAQNYDAIFEILNSYPQTPDIVIFEGGKLKVELCKKDGHGSSSSLYIEDSLGKDDDVFKRLIFKHNISSIWKAYLINSMTYCLPHFWHAIYASRDYVFSHTDLVDIYNGYDDVSSEILDHDVRPQIFYSNSKNYVQCCYWNSWRGLVKETILVDIPYNDGNAHFKHIYDEVLYEYDCGIIF